MRTQVNNFCLVAMASLLLPISAFADVRDSNGNLITTQSGDAVINQSSNFIPEKTVDDTAATSESTDVPVALNPNPPKKFKIKDLHSLGEIFDLSPEGPIHQAWEQLKINIPVSLVNLNGTVGSSLSDGFSIKQTYLVQPAFIKDYQQRLDQYTINLGISNALSLFANAGLAIRTQISFSRLFENKGAALKAPFYFPNKIPWKAKDALENLNHQDMIRMDMLAGANIGPGHEFDAPHLDTKFMLNAGLVRNSELVVDLYKMKDSFLRMRIVAILHILDFTLNASLALYKPNDLGMSIIEKLTAGAFSFRPFSLGMNTNLKHHPVNTFMVDYVFDLAKPEGASAFEDTMSALHKLKTYEFLNFQTDTRKVDERVLTLIGKPEQQAKADAGLPVAQRSVQRVFKGESNNDYYSWYTQNLLSLEVPIVNKKVDNSNSVAKVRGFDHDDNPIDMLYLTRNSVHNFQLAGGYWQTLENNEVDSLFQAQQTEGVYSPNKMSDIVLIKGLSDKRFSKRQYMRATNFVKLTVPSASDQLPNVDFKNASKIINGYYKFRLVIHPEIMDALPSLSSKELYYRIQALIQKDPFASEIKVVNTVNDDDGNGGRRTLSTMERLQNDAAFMADKFAVFTDKTSSMKDKYDAYAQLRTLELFEELGPALMTSLLSPADVENYVFMTVAIGGDNLKATNITIGKKDVSDFYSSFQYMQTLLNSRTFDLRLQLSGSGQLEPVKEGGNNTCANCDSLKTIEK